MARRRLADPIVGARTPPRRECLSSKYGTVSYQTGEEKGGPESGLAAMPFTQGSSTLPLQLGSSGRRRGDRGSRCSPFRSSGRLYRGRSLGFAKRQPGACGILACPMSEESTTDLVELVRESGTPDVVEERCWAAAPACR